MSLYLSVTEHAGSAVLVKEVDGLQHPVYYVSKSFLSVETRYSILERYVLILIMSCVKLRPYFEGHHISVKTNLPIKAVLRKPDLSGRMNKWSVQLSTYDISYEPRTAIKSQALADFIADFSSALEEQVNQEVFMLETNLASVGLWKLYTDGASNARGTGLGVVLKSPQGDIIARAVRCNFKATNNEAEYEALISGLQVSLDLGVKHIEVKTDSLLIVNQVNGSFCAKDQWMFLYLDVINSLRSKFDSFKIEQIPRELNTQLMP